MENIWLIPLGIAIGALGTLIGAGGGFILSSGAAFAVSVLFFGNSDQHVAGRCIF